MSRKYMVQYESVKSNPSSSRFYRGFVKIGGFRIDVIPSGGEDPCFVRIGRNIYIVKGEPDERGEGWVRYIEVGK